jgi:hypothetical protein
MRSARSLSCFAIHNCYVCEVIPPLIVPQRIRLNIEEHVIKISVLQVPVRYDKDDIDRPIGADSQLLLLSHHYLYCSNSRLFIASQYFVEEQ